RPRGFHGGEAESRLEPWLILRGRDPGILLPRVRERLVPYPPRQTGLREVHGRAPRAVRVPARPVRAVGRGAGERGGTREGKNGGRPLRIPASTASFNRPLRSPRLHGGLVPFPRVDREAGRGEGRLSRR